MNLEKIIEALKPLEVVYRDDDEAAGFYVCEEMQKLRNGLTARGIEWKDASEKNPAYWICRTHYTHNKSKWSVVHGFGTYGGFSSFSEDSKLLECMAGMNEPVGWLTAADVFEMMEGENHEP